MISTIHVVIYKEPISYTSILNGTKPRIIVTDIPVFTCLNTKQLGSWVSAYEVCPFTTHIFLQQRVSSAHLILNIYRKGS